MKSIGYRQLTLDGCFQLDSLSTMAADYTKKQGFITTWDNMLEKLFLVVTELAEMGEAYEEDNRAHVAEEAADVFVRMFDICGCCNIDIGQAFMDKVNYNNTRPYQHGRKKGDLIGTKPSAFMPEAFSVISILANAGNSYRKGNFELSVILLEQSSKAIQDFAEKWKSQIQHEEKVDNVPA